MKKLFAGKNFLISAGPTWVPIDKVRVITNIFGGALGYLIAEKSYQMGARVTLLMGPGRVAFTGKEKIRLKKFKYFGEIYNLLEKEVKSKKYDVLIHSAAIPDYVPSITHKGKIKSGKRNFIIKFKPTIKIVDKIKKWDPNTFLVKFKLEVNKSKKQLIDIAYESMLHSKANLMVANDFKTVSREHQAFIIDKNRNIKEIRGKEKITLALLKIIYTELKNA